MGIRFLCPNGHKLNVKAELAGKRGSCPECGAKLVIPSVDVEPPPVSPSSAAEAAVWFARMADGNQLGPATDAEFGRWIAAGQVLEATPVWRAGWPDWKLAGQAVDVLPAPLVTQSQRVAQTGIADEAPHFSAPALGFPNSEPVFAPVIDDSPVIALPEAAIDVTAEPKAPSPSTYAFQRRQNKQTQLTIALVMLMVVVILACILIWVLSRKDQTTTEPASDVPPVAAPAAPAPADAKQ